MPHNAEAIEEWIREQFMEEYKDADKDRQRELREIAVSRRLVEEYCEEQISEDVTLNSLVEAIVTSINVNRLQGLLEHIIHTETCRHCGEYTCDSECENQSCQEIEMCDRCHTDFKKEHFDTKGLCADCGGWAEHGEAEGSDTDA
jgi:hypothetical protein